MVYNSKSGYCFLLAELTDSTILAYYLLDLSQALCSCRAPRFNWSLNISFSLVFKYMPSYILKPLMHYGQCASSNICGYSKIPFLITKPNHSSVVYSGVYLSLSAG